MKYILIVMLMVTISVQAENVMWETDNGRIIGHTSKDIEVGSDYIKCGTKLKSIKAGKVSIGSVAVWVKGAKNISELGTITPVNPKDEESDYDKWTPKEKAMLKVLIKEINTLRAEHSLPARNKSQVVAAIKAEL